MVGCATGVLPAGGKNDVSERKQNVLCERAKSILPGVTIGKSPLFPIALTVLFFAVGILGITHHEMWRDELRAWLIARDSSTLFQLFNALRYEGTPPLWHLCLFGLTRFTSEPLAMQIFHLSLASACVFLVTRFSPFSMWQKALITFGYFPFFEYAQISRGYVLSNLFLFMICALCREGRRNYPLLVLLLFLLANTTVYGAIFAFAVGASLLFERFDFNGRHVRLPNKRILAAGLATFLVSLALFYVQVKPPLDGYSGDWNSYSRKFFKDSDPTVWRITRSCSTVLTSYLPVPDPTFKHRFWGTTIFRDQDPLRYVWAVISLVLFLYIARNLKDKLSRTAYLLGTLGFVAFTFLFYLGASRHNGQLFVLLLACGWLALDSQRRDASSVAAQHEVKPDGISLQARSNNRFNRDSFLPAYLLNAILTVHVIVGVFAFHTDFRKVFSPNRDIANFLREKHLDNHRIVVTPDYCGTGLSTYLNRRVYSLASRTEFSYEPLDKSDRQEVWGKAVPGRVSLLARWWDRPFLLLSRDRLPPEVPFASARLLNHFGDSIVLYEGQYLYLVEPPSKTLSPNNKQPSVWKTKVQSTGSANYLLWRMWPTQKVQRFFYSDFYPTRYTGQRTSRGNAQRQFRFWLRPINIE